MENISALLALCEGNPPVTGGVPSWKAGNSGFDVFFDVSLTKWLNKPSNDLRRHDAHCDCFVMHMR